MEIESELASVSDILNTLNTDESVQAAGFMIGFMYRFKFNHETLYNPLTTIYEASLYGYVTRIGSSFLSGMMPDNIKFIVPLTAITSCIYYKYIDYQDYLQKKNKLPTSCADKPIESIESIE